MRRVTHNDYREGLAAMSSSDVRPSPSDAASSTLVGGVLLQSECVAKLHTRSFFKDFGRGFSGSISCRLRRLRMVYDRSMRRSINVVVERINTLWFRILEAVAILDHVDWRYHS